MNGYVMQLCLALQAALVRYPTPREQVIDAIFPDQKEDEQYANQDQRSAD